MGPIRKPMNNDETPRVENSTKAMSQLEIDNRKTESNNEIFYDGPSTSTQDVETGDNNQSTSGYSYYSLTNVQTGIYPHLPNTTNDQVLPHVRGMYQGTFDENYHGNHYQNSNDRPSHSM